MKTPIDFYFDFTSPYSYLASEMIEPLAARHDRDVAYRPTLLGAPYFFVDQEPFWGSDRLPQIERWLATGAF